MKGFRRLWLGIAVLILLTPIGLYVPARFGAGTAWGEWSSGELRRILGYVPKGLREAEGIWKAPLPDYAPKGQEQVSPAAAGAYYIVSAVIGVTAAAAAALLLGRLLAKREKH